MTLAEIINPWGALAKAKAHGAKMFQAADERGQELIQARFALAKQAEEIRILRKQVALFDHDGSGRVGGSAKRKVKS